MGIALSALKDADAHSFSVLNRVEPMPKINRVEPMPQTNRVEPIPRIDVSDIKN